MSGETFLQILIYLQVFIIGILATIAFRHAKAHRTESREPETPLVAHPSIELPADVKQRLLQASEAQFQQVLKQSAGQLQGDLQISAGQINNLVNHLAAEIVSGELERYRLELSRLSQQANAEMGGIRTEVAKHQAEIKAKLDQEMAAEKQWLLQQIDTKLADAVGSFLTETLQHNVDLGNQNAYLVSMLEEHKADFIKEVSDEIPAAK